MSSTDPYPMPTVIPQEPLCPVCGLQTDLDTDTDQFIAFRCGRHGAFDIDTVTWVDMV